MACVHYAFRFCVQCFMPLFFPRVYGCLQCVCHGCVALYEKRISQNVAKILIQIQHLSQQFRAMANINMDDYRLMAYTNIQTNTTKPLELLTPFQSNRIVIVVRLKMIESSLFKWSSEVNQSCYRCRSNNCVEPHILY